jgi:hypothetical protein
MTVNEIIRERCAGYALGLDRIHRELVAMAGDVERLLTAIEQSDKVEEVYELANLRSRLRELRREG